MRFRKMTAAFCLSIAASSAATGQDEPQFGYSGQVGPEHWASLSPDWSLCGTGRSQSPINIAHAVDEDQSVLTMHYRTGSSTFVNNGHAVQVNYDAGSALAIEGGSTFELRQFHFHAPSEHQIDGENLPAEIHLVHTDAGGNLAVVSLLVEESGGANPTIAELWNQLPGSRGITNDLPGINAADLLPEDRSHYSYSGSLTTPPCSEGVQWIVMKQPVTLSTEQIAALKRAIGIDNNRPVQGLNGRTIAE